ncbi:CheR family methyltransferase [Roseibium salinum]|uniref:Uncharacterized protein n=1 Tax=Roseibium salinum TaxID=1604349 RepID=A0ABT3QWX8_9HYPH|nr:CheR family methyltransferase [Roseibium sp. DSM 29163]MCX2721444.1 hypothetical protein [Roseibium sp. DSM 29163]
MEGFFNGVPENPQAAFVIVTHLNPERESVLHEVVGRYTELPVLVADDGMQVENNHIYVMPSNAILTIKNRVLQMRRPDATERPRRPIDIFLSSLAEDQGAYAVAVILSGGDGDGTLGAKVIKLHGGLTMAQTADGSRPQNPSMPESAISSGVVDLPIPVEQMGARVADLSCSFDRFSQLVEEGETEETDRQGARQEICSILQSHTGHDFSGYKTKTFMRRSARRMQVLQLESLAGYVELLGRDAAEVMNLFRDLLINVTNFFRDDDAFAALEQQVIPRLFEGHDGHNTIRVWVPGCATGEEVYSLAILIREHLDTLSIDPQVQVFAIDIDDQALTVARAGRYPVQLMAGVTPERRERFFKRDGETYVIGTEIREWCVFSPHNLIGDPPFSRMDLVSCRNLLIYLGSEAQHRVIPTFHYALRPGGFLFLGTSESLGQHGELFFTVDKKNRIFQARETASNRRLPVIMGNRVNASVSGRAPCQGVRHPCLCARPWKHRSSTAFRRLMLLLTARVTSFIIRPRQENTSSRHRVSRTVRY